MLHVKLKRQPNISVPRGTAARTQLLFHDLQVQAPQGTLAECTLLLWEIEDTVEGPL